MRLKLLILILAAFPINIYSIDYYFHKGEKIELRQRADKIAVVLNDSLPESYVSERVRGIISSGYELKKSIPGIYLINFSTKKEPGELQNYLNSFANRKDIFKFATKVYYGSSRKVSQIPTDRFAVRLKNSSDAWRLGALNSKYNCIITGKVRDEKGFIIRSNRGVDLNALELADLYYSTGLFEYVSPDFLYPDGCLLLSVPNDLHFNSQWALKNTGQLLNTGSPFLQQGDSPVVNGIPGSDMNVSSAWDVTSGSPNVTVGIIDTGIDSLHADLQAPGHLMPGYDAFNDVPGSSYDYANHGTSVAGLIGAVMNNSIGITGVAPNCKLMSISIFDVNGNTSGLVIARAFDSARVKGIDIINNSWGGMTPDQLITDAIDNAAYNGRGGLGCIILFSSGNDGLNPPVYPSKLPNVLSVGSSTPHDQKKSHGTGNQFYWGSNYGENASGDLDIVAPTNCYTISAGLNSYNENFSGTSASCANASGVAALVLSVNETQTRYQVFQNIIKGCDKIDNVPYNADKIYGKWSNLYGYGRLNALNSVKLAEGIDVTPPSISHTNVQSHNSTYPTIIKADIVDQGGASVPINGDNAPKLFFKIKKNTSGWTPFDSVAAYQITGNEFRFKVPSQGWQTEVYYYIRARDNFGNETTFPKHAPNPFWLCYFAVGNLTSETQKIGSFRGADFSPTLSPAVTFSGFKIVGTHVRIYMRHTYLDDESIQIFSPLADANNNRKCLFACNGGELDNITGAVVSDTASKLWAQDTPPYTNGSYKSDFSMRGFNGQSAGGNWRILHFDRAVGDYAFFDSIYVTLCKTSGSLSSAIRLNNPSDSILLFEESIYPNIYDKDFYLKNSGTTSLSLSGINITGPFAGNFTLLNVPPSSIAPNDSGLFRIRLNTTIGAGPIQNATINMNTNDPSKPQFKVSLQTSDSIHSEMKTLDLTVLTQGLYDDELNISVPDTVSVYIRSFSSPYSVVDIAKGVLNENGFVSLGYSNVLNNTDYYIQVDHRNSVQTWSATGEKFVNSELSYNFTTDSIRAYGNNLTPEDGKYCIYSGDINKDGYVDISDLVSIFNASSLFAVGYIPEDLTGDSSAGLSDIVIAFNNSTKFVRSITP